MSELLVYCKVIVNPIHTFCIFKHGHHFCKRACCRLIYAHRIFYFSLIFIAGDYLSQWFIVKAAIVMMHLYALFTFCLLYVQS